MPFQLDWWERTDQSESAACNLSRNPSYDSFILKPRGHNPRFRDTDSDTK
jgi:hypothetical protein